MITKAIKKLIEKNSIALATCNNNKPHVIAVCCVKVFSKDELIITDNFMRTTKENIKKNKKIGLAVWNNNKGYHLEGNAIYHNSGKWLDYVKKLKDNRGLPAKGAILVKVNKITGLVG